MTPFTAFRIVASTLLAILTGIATNLATSADAGRGMWLLVGVVTLLSIGVALWTAPERRRPAEDRERVAAGRYAPDPPTGPVAVRGGTGPHGGRSSGVALVLVALAAGAGLGLGYANNRRPDPAPTPTVVTPGPTTPTADAGPTPDNGSEAPAPHRVTPTPHRTPVVPPHDDPPPADPPQAESVVGEWYGVEVSSETLSVNANSTYSWLHDTGASEAGRYTVDGSRLTLTPDSGASRTFGWSVVNAELTLTDRKGAQHQFGRV